MIKNKSTFGTLKAAKKYYGAYDAFGTPYISDGDSARVLFFANLSGAYDGNARAVEAYNDFVYIANAVNSHRAMVEAVKKCIECEERRREKLLPGAPATTYTEARIKQLREALKLAGEEA